MADETMSLEQVRDSLRAECERVEKDSMKYAECAYQVPAWVLSDLADAIDSAIAARKVPDGWQLVPIEPTVEMMKEADGVGFHVHTGTWTIDPCDCYAAMLAAAPKVTP